MKLKVRHYIENGELYCSDPRRPRRPGPRTVTTRNIWAVTCTKCINNLWPLNIRDDNGRFRTRKRRKIMDSIGEWSLYMTVA